MGIVKHIPAALPLVLMGLLAGCAQHQLVKGDHAFERMAWADAACHYEQALLKMDDRSIALRAAEAYRRKNDLAKAADWFAYAERMAPLNMDEALAYGRVLQSLGRSGLAAGQFEHVLADRPEDPVVRQLGSAVVDRGSFYEDTTLFTVTPLQLNGLVSAFGATPEGAGIVFAAEKPAQGRNTNPWNGASFLDLYSAQPSASGIWSEPVPLKGDVNMRFHEGPAVISADGKSMYFTRSDYFKFRLNKDENAVSHLMLFRADKQADGTWGAIHSFAYNGADFSAGHAALSKDGNTLYYISDMPGGFGGTDLYACTRTTEGWGYPRNLGTTINTSANEMFPTVVGDTLYFASNGHRTMGGLDIVYSVLKDDVWSEPTNMNYPINTSYDDFSLTLLPNGHGYLSSDRLGSDRIYTFQPHDPTLLLEASFVDEETGAPMANVEVRMLEPTEPEPINLFTDEDGAVSFPLSPERVYQLYGSKDGVFTESREISTVGQRTSRTYQETFRMRPIVLDKPIVIENIYYDYDKWDIRPDAAIELDKVARLFLDNPDLSFELGSHTDSRASDTYNLLLSDARAKSAVDYLVRMGVPSQRLSGRGYGESRPVNRCKNDIDCSEDEHQANRRTEFKVTNLNTDVSVSESR